MKNITSETNLPAHRAVIGENEATDLLKSQSLEIMQKPTSGDFIASVLSLSARFPPFDYASHNGFRYLRFRGATFMALKEESQKAKLIILPTDDEKINLLIIPKSVLPELAATLTEAVHDLSH